MAVAPRIHELIQISDDFAKLMEKTPDEIRAMSLSELAYALYDRGYYLHFLHGEANIPFIITVQPFTK